MPILYECIEHISYLFLISISLKKTLMNINKEKEIIQSIKYNSLFELLYFI